MNQDLEQLYLSFEDVEHEQPTCGPTRGPGQVPVSFCGH
jgi:hypothetical protein